MQVIATKYLVVGDYSIKPGNVISEAPFNLSKEVLADFVKKDQAYIFDDQPSVEEGSQDEYVVLVLDENGNELMTMHEHDEESELVDNQNNEEDEVDE